MAENFDPWAILGVGADASPAEVKAAWRALAVQFHPDRYASAPVADQRRAAAHMTAVNIAYDEIRSGRARSTRVTTTAAPADTGVGHDTGFGHGSGAGERWDAPDPGTPWFDDEVLVAALRRAEERRRSWKRRGRLRLVASVAGLTLLAVLFHLSMLRTYGFDLVYDGEGRRYEDVACGNGYDRGRTTADALRAEAATSSSSAELLHKAEVIEAVCDDWTGVARMVVLPAACLFVGAFYLVFLRRRR